MIKCGRKVFNGFVYRHTEYNVHGISTVYRAVSRSNIVYFYLSTLYGYLV